MRMLSARDRKFWILSDGKWARRYPSRLYALQNVFQALASVCPPFQRNGQLFFAQVICLLYKSYACLYELSLVACSITRRPFLDEALYRHSTSTSPIRIFQGFCSVSTALFTVLFDIARSSRLLLLHVSTLKPKIMHSRTSGHSLLP